jgi:DNA-binding response OmpR family regulator
VRRLRKVLEASGAYRYIQTVRGAGYRFSSRIADA